MKRFRILAHPYTLLLCFSFMLISGQSMGGFYILYLLMGLLHGVLHALLGFYGMLILVIGYHLPSRWKAATQVLNVMSVSMMVASVYFFFSQDAAHYNWGTFQQGLPMFTLVFTGFIALCFLVGTFWKPQPGNGSRQGVLSKV